MYYMYTKKNKTCLLYCRCTRQTAIAHKLVTHAVADSPSADCVVVEVVEAVVSVCWVATETETVQCY